MKEVIKIWQGSGARLILFILAVTGLALVFIFQRVDWLTSFLGYSVSAEWRFILLKSVRVFLNDIFMLLILHVWFNDKSITRLAIMVQLIDMLILLPAYLIVKLKLEGTSEISSPLLSQWHRLIINPTLMILIIPGVYLQRLRLNSK